MDRRAGPDHITEKVGQGGSYISPASTPSPAGLVGPVVQENEPDALKDLGFFDLLTYIHHRFTGNG